MLTPDDVGPARLRRLVGLLPVPVLGLFFALGLRYQRRPLELFNHVPVLLGHGVGSIRGRDIALVGPGAFHPDSLQSRGSAFRWVGSFERKNVILEKGDARKSIGKTDWTSQRGVREHSRNDQAH